MNLKPPNEKQNNETNLFIRTDLVHRNSMHPVSGSVWADPATLDISVLIRPGYLL